MVLGTHYAVTGVWSAGAALASLVPFFLVSNLLLLNQFPDVAADGTVGRDNLPIALGLRRSLQVFGLFGAAAFLVVGAGVAGGLFPGPALVGLVTLPLAVRVYRRMGAAIAASGPSAAMVRALGLNVALTLATPVLLGAGILAGA
jgi:1,4-dihydroxy-2-naphthoate octaprenyltransferase